MANYARKVKIPGKKAAELYKTLTQDIDRLMSKISLGKYEVDPKPNEQKVDVKGPGFSATLACADEQMSVEAQLGLLVVPFKGKLDEAITRWLNKTFELGLS